MGEAARDKLRRMILARKPWLRSSGPRSVAGKAKSRRNSWKHGYYAVDAQVLRSVVTRCN